MARLQQQALDFIIDALKDVGAVAAYPLQGNNPLRGMGNFEMVS